VELVADPLEQRGNGPASRFITSVHHGFAWRYYEPSFAYDGANPEYDDLYTRVHEPKAPPSRHFQDRWAAEVYEVLKKYQPDLIYFDFEFYEVITAEYQQRLFAMAYDWAARNRREICVTQKSRAIHEHTGILDFERGRADTITPYPWLTDTATGPWFYVAAEKLKTAGYLISILADIVSKNGCMMLDVGPSVDILVQIGRWLGINGEAIYGTRPWTAYGEGPTHNPAGASFSESKDQPYTNRDVRYTTKGNALYAIVLGRPQGTVHLTSVNPGKLWFGPVRNIHVLGSQEKVAWRPSDAGIALEVPAAALPKVGDSWVLKIT
jgi:alpha-L-fucosidase